MKVAGSYWKYPDPTAGALWYHAYYVRPHWAGERYIMVGSHKFYKEI
jgi:spore germination cell wall hydrolase CwlJ-like protein